MTRDEIVRLAREAGVMPIDHFYVTDVFLQRFVHLVEQRLIRDGYRKCAEGQRTTQFCGLLDAAVKAEREKVAAWMRSKSYATGHGDTVEDLLKELEWQVAEREREACAKACDHIKNDIYNNSQEDTQPMAHAVANFCAAAIRARNEQ